MVRSLRPLIGSLCLLCAASPASALDAGAIVSEGASIVPPPSWLQDLQQVSAGDDITFGLRTLWSGALAPGARTRVVWNGCDDHGRRAASGTYLLRLITDAGEEATRRVTMAK